MHNGPAAANDPLSIADLTPTRGLTDQFDDVLLKLCDTSLHVLATDVSYDSRFCQHIRYALEADTVYLCNRDTLNITSSSTENSNTDACADTKALHAALLSMVGDLWNCASPIRTPDIRVYPDEPQFSYLILPINDHLLVLVNAEANNFEPGQYFADAITSLHTLFKTDNLPTTDDCQQHVFDVLQSRYLNSSKQVIARRLALFHKQLRTTPINFEHGAIKSKQPLKATSVDSLQNIATQWGKHFITVLDLHLLSEASYSYKALCESTTIQKFTAARPLQLTVHSSSLQTDTYLSKLQELLECAVLHGSKLNLDIKGTLTESSAFNALCQHYDVTPLKPRTTGSQFSIADEFSVPGVNTSQPTHRLVK